MSTTNRNARGTLGPRIRLSAFARSLAQQVADEEGFGYVATPNAPSTYQELRGAYAHSKATGEPLPISNLYCEDTVFMEPSDNHAWRFVHDVCHNRLGLSFGLADEWELACFHLGQLTVAGFGPTTTEYELLRLDLLGQIILLGVAARFPHRQGEFTRSCAELGLDQGVLAELRRLA